MKTAFQVTSGADWRKTGLSSPKYVIECDTCPGLGRNGRWSATAEQSGAAQRKADRHNAERHSVSKTAEKQTVVIAKVPNPGMDAAYHVHGVGCPDLKRMGKYLEQYRYSVESPDVAYQKLYPPNEFLYDPNDPEDRASYEGDVKIFPCARKT